MNETSESGIDALLRARFDGEVPDAGFSARVVRHLPQRRRRSGWLPWVGLLAGAGACWLALLLSPLVDMGWRDWLRGDWSGSAVTLLAAACTLTLLLALWGATEIADG